MSRKLYVHLGPSKTGTSAIQGFFRDSSQNSILYPETGRWPDGSHHKLVFALGGRTKYGPINIPPWAELLSKLEQEISISNKDILLSSEVASIEFVEALKALTTKHCLELNIILVVRNPIERAASAYNQGVKDPVVGLHQDPDEYLQNRKYEFRFKPLYEKWLAFDSNVDVIPYRHELPLIQRFCALLGVNWINDDLVKHPNKSMGGAALLTILIANKILSNEEDRRTFFSSLQKNEKFKIWQGESFPFSKQASTNFYAAIKPDIDWIVDKFGFSEIAINAKSNKPFSITKTEIENIYNQLSNAGLIDQNEQLFDHTLKPFCS